MLLFIIIFFAMLIVVGATAIVGFSAYLKRRTAKSLETKNQKQFADAPPYRSLFEPSDEEIRALERETQTKDELEKKEDKQKVSFAKAERVNEFGRVWSDEPNNQNTIELLRLAATSESAEIFSQTAESVIELWRDGRAGNMSKKDLADLLDSHSRTLPQQERTSGVIFWLKREIEKLRAESERL